MKKMNDFKITQTIAEGFDNDNNLIYRLYLAKLKGYLSLRAQYIGKEKTREYVFENTIFPNKERRDEALQEIKELKYSILMREHTLLEEYEEKFHD